MVGFAGLGELRCLKRCRLEEGIALAASSAFEQHDFLSVLGDLTYLCMVFGVKGHGAQWDIDVDIIASGTGELVFATRNPVASEDMLRVTQVEQGPQLCIATQDDITAATAVAAVGTAFWDVFLPTEVQRTCTAFARAAEYLYVIYKV